MLRDATLRRVTTRPFGPRVMAVFFGLIAINPWTQAIPELVRTGDDPIGLTLLQLASAISATAAAVGSWRMARWAPWAALAYGVITGAMVAALGPLLALPPEARPGLIGSGVGIAVVGAACAWYLRRATVRASI